MISKAGGASRVSTFAEYDARAKATQTRGRETEWTHGKETRKGELYGMAQDTLAPGVNLTEQLPL